MFISSWDFFQVIQVQDHYPWKCEFQKCFIKNWEKINFYDWQARIFCQAERKFVGPKIKRMYMHLVRTDKRLNLRLCYFFTLYINHLSKINEKKWNVGDVTHFCIFSFTIKVTHFWKKDCYNNPSKHNLFVNLFKNKKYKTK